ncbi:MAG: hypothetical protein ACRDEB_09375 [Chitinophagaceae bacterium]
MKLKMPKLAFRVIVGLIMVSFVAASCGNKKSDKEKEATKDTVQKKPTETGN